VYLTKLIQKQGILLLFIGIIFAVSGCSLSSSSSTQHPADQENSMKLVALNESADQLYRLAKAGRFVEAREQLMRVSDQMTKITYNGLTTPEGLNAWTKLVIEARSIYNKASFIPSDALLAALKIKLAADAIGHKEKPIWLGYYRTFKSDASELNKMIKSKSSVLAKQALQRFQGHYLLIRPAVLISRSPQLVEKIDSWFIYMNGLLSQSKVDYAKVGDGAAFTNDLLAELFEGKEAPAFGTIAPHKQPIVLASVLLGAILSVLLYVGWKKYKFTAG